MVCSSPLWSRSIDIKDPFLRQDPFTVSVAHFFWGHRSTCFLYKWPSPSRNWLRSHINWNSTSHVGGVLGRMRTLKTRWLGQGARLPPSFPFGFSLQFWDRIGLTTGFHFYADYQFVWLLACLERPLLFWWYNNCCPLASTQLLVSWLLVEHLWASCRRCVCVYIYGVRQEYSFLDDYLDFWLSVKKRSPFSPLSEILC